MERIVIDTNVLANFFLKTKLSKRAKNAVKQALAEYSPILFTNILEETVFILIREELIYRGMARFYEQKNFIKRNGYEDLFVYKKFFEFLKRFEIPILENKFSISDFQDILENYNLLPNDALIASTCKHHGIKKIATFDEDFKRVDFLEIITP